MKKVGLFEAKTRLSEICEQVARLQEPVLVTKRGEPFVRIEPLLPAPKQENVWKVRKRFESEFGPMKENFEAPKRRSQSPKNVLDD